MIKNEPVIINKAGNGYIVKPLSYMFHDEGEETFEAFSSVTEMAEFLLKHFETQAGGAHIPTNHTPVTHEQVIALKAKEEKANVRTTSEPCCTPKTKK